MDHRAKARPWQHIVIAHAAGKKILCASYTDIESIYYGEDPNNVCELFRTA